MTGGQLSSATATNSAERRARQVAGADRRGRATTLKWWRPGMKSGPVAPGGRFAGQASHSSRDWRRNSRRLVGAARRSRSGASVAARVDAGRQPRAPRASSSLKSPLNENCDQRREVVDARQRDAAGERAPREPDARASRVANSIAARCPPAEWPPTTSGLAPRAVLRSLAREPRDRRAGIRRRSSRS